jgi:putative DeoR family transcriptional regulator (stage III sporulation protein D)
MYWSEIMKNQSDKRAIELGQFIIENKSTVRAAAGEFGISKSTVHKDVSERLSKINPELYAEVKKVLEINKSERHIRGGMATKKKYQELAKCRQKYSAYFHKH